MSKEEKVLKKEKGLSWPFWISAGIIWLVISAFFVVRFIDPVIESLLLKIIPEKSFIYFDFWIAFFETIVMMSMGILSTIYFQNLVSYNLRQVHKELLEKLGKDSHDNAYFAYHTIITHTQEMKNLVNKLVNLPQHPKLLKILIEDYSKKATDSKFLVDFPTFLKLAGIFVENSTEMSFVNTTPPYGWWHPIGFERNKEIKEAIENYEKKIENKLKKKSKVSRITIIEKIENRSNTFDMALSSALEHGFYTYFNILGVDINSSDKDDNIARPIIAWIENVLKKFLPRISNSSEAILKNILEIISSPNNMVQRFTDLLSSYWEPTPYSFKENFKILSKEISMLILQDFIELHYPKSEAFYILKDKVSDSKKDDIHNWAKEEGIFKDSAGNRYLIRIEEANGINVLLVTIRSIDSIDDTHFKKLKDNFIDTSTERTATGRLQDLIKEIRE